MIAFQEGFIPAGWERGEPLKVRPAQALDNGQVYKGCVYQECVGLTIAGGPVDEAHVARVEFWPHQAAAVQRWLKWWHS